MKKILLFLIFSGLSFGLFAQDNKLLNASSENYQYADSGFEKGKLYVITRFDDHEYIGEILLDDGREILLKTKTVGNVFIPKYEIKRIVEIQDEKLVVYNEYQFTGPFTTRYSFTTNALPINKGQNYGMLNLYGPEAHLALTDRLNVGIMSSWIASPIIIATKYSFAKEESTLNFSFGSLVGTSGYLNSFKGFGGLHWLNLTKGDRKNNITVSGGYAYLQSGNSQPNEGMYIGDQYEESSNQAQMQTIHGPIFSLAGIFKIGARSSFVFDSMIGSFTYEKYSENMDYDQRFGDVVYVINRKPNSQTTVLFVMPGVRFQKTDNKAFQISIAGVSMYGDADVSFPIPMCTWFYRF